MRKCEYSMQGNYTISCYLPYPVFVFFFKTSWVTLNPLCLLCILPSPRGISLGFGPKYNHTPTYQVEAGRGQKKGVKKQIMSQSAARLHLAGLILGTAVYFFFSCFLPALKPTAHLFPF